MAASPSSSESVWQTMSNSNRVGGDDALNLIKDFSRPGGIASLLQDTAPRLQQERIMTVNEDSPCGLHGRSNTEIQNLPL